MDRLQRLGIELYECEKRMRFPPRVLRIRPAKNELAFYSGRKRVSEETLSRSAAAKVLMADSSGHALFINDLMHLPARELKRLNEMLSEHPLYPVLVDNGRYSHYQLEAGSYREYIRQDLYRPDKDLFVVGSVEKAKGKGLRHGAGEGEKEKAAKDLERRRGNAERYQKFIGIDSNTVQKGMGVR
jgi:hypothetical protein